jgi:hypothetical protein
MEGNGTLMEGIQMTIGHYRVVRTTAAVVIYIPVDYDGHRLRAKDSSHTDYNIELGYVYQCVF